MSLSPNVSASNTEDLMRLLSTPNVWQPRSVEDEPFVQMNRWTVKECFTAHYGERTRHLVGNTGSGRVTSAVRKWEIVKEGILATTDSGRQYLLVNSPALNMDAAYVWSSWININNAEDITDVTVEYWDNETDTPKLPAK